MRLLQRCKVRELRDHAFGDREIAFVIPEKELGDGADPDYREVFGGYRDQEGQPWRMEYFSRCVDVDGQDTGEIVIAEGYGDRKGLTVSIGAVGFDDRESRELLEELRRRGRVRMSRNDVGG